MISREQLDKLFPGEADKCFRYLENKHKGGTNNTKGNTFENQFAVYKIATAFNDKSDRESTLFSAQAFCFIDDLIIEKEHNNAVEHYQVKDVENLGWNQPPHPLETDFQLQHSVCTDNGKTATLHLVVSRRELSEELTNNMSPELNRIASVIHFQNATSINKLIAHNEAFRTALKEMCALDNPGTDKLDTLGNIILGVWGGLEQMHAPLSEIIDKCHSLKPNYIRGLEDTISEKLRLILDNIPGFTYTVEGGYINWQYKDTDKGTVSYRIGTIEFDQWENDVFNAGTLTTFEELEPYLT